MATQTDAAPISLSLDLAQMHHIHATPPEGGGAYTLTTTGDDPFVLCQPLTGAYDPGMQYVLSFEYICMKGIDSLEVFYGPPIRAGQSAVGPEILSSEGWTRYALNIKTGQHPGSWRGAYTQFRLDFGRRAGRTIQLRNIQLRTPNEYERKAAREADSRKAATGTFDEKLQAFVAAEYADRIKCVSATETELLITVRAEVDNLTLCEVPFYQSPLNRREFVWQQAIAASGDTHTISVPRLRGSHDRVFSSWILMRDTAQGPVPASHQRFVDALPARAVLTRDRPLNRKGCTGLHGGHALQVEDYKALGIHNATKNIILTALVGTEPGEDTQPHMFNGHTVHIKRPALKALDKAMREMAGLKIVVSAIILIPRDTPMSHPDCTPQGIYAMANVVEREGWNNYAAGLDFLAQRYMRADRRYGRITHWILHNEVDAGWIWTNAGEIPMHTYVDLHYRSMRTAQNVIRRYGDAGEVLVSLTHYWTGRHNARCYPPKEMIDLIARRSVQEGDFDWGLAYHPYPQNLRDPRTWLDKKATFDFQTTLITPRNLEVLDAYMRQDAFLYEGKTRTIVLSEQGSNSAGHDEKSYRDQSAGLAYTWLKLKPLASIESYIHHRWMDHAQEGGLNLGLRRNEEPEAGKKPAWDIFRQLETTDEASVFKWMRSVVPEAQRSMPSRSFPEMGVRSTGRDE